MEGGAEAIGATLVLLLTEDTTKEDRTHPETREGPLYPLRVGEGDPLTSLATGRGPLATEGGPL